jgi:DNA-binding transcriptional MerR regulator
MKRVQDEISPTKGSLIPGGVGDYPRQAGRIAGGDEKIFYKIGEVSTITGLEPYVLRYWETEFPVLRPRKSRGGQRVYRRKDVENVLRIKQMLYNEGYTISGARKALGRKGSGTGSGSPGYLVKLRTDLADILRILSSHGHRG